MKARIRNTLWVVSAVVGLTLFLMPTVVVLAYPALPITAALLSIPRVSRRRAPREHRDESDPWREFNASPYIATKPWEDADRTSPLRGHLPGDRK
jgi:hypothetical protein